MAFDSLLDPFMMNGDEPLARKVMIELVRRAAPRAFWVQQAHILRTMSYERELALLPVLCRPDGVGLDVGAARGVYSVQMVDRVSKCIAFEPRPWQAEYLRDLVRYADLPVMVEEVALSDVDGNATLRVPVEQQGLSTVESANKLYRADGPDERPIVTVEIKTRKLDAYCEKESIGFIKIDVEGHEGAVLRGAEAVLRKQRPRLLIEVEDRHRPGAVGDVFHTMETHGYAGFFLYHETLLAISEFDSAVHQDPCNGSGWENPGIEQPPYFNNFIFVPKEESAEICASVIELLNG
jgi:FkbM family methyltransferase